MYCMTATQNGMSSQDRLRKGGLFKSRAMVGGLDILLSFIEWLYSIKVKKGAQTLLDSCFIFISCSTLTIPLVCFVDMILHSCPFEYRETPTAAPFPYYIGYHLLQLVQMHQSCQHNLLTCLLNLAGEEDLIEDSIDLQPTVRCIHTKLPF